MKTTFARQYIVQHAKGKGKREFVNELLEAGIQVSERQFDRWVVRIKSGEQAIKSNKLSGARPSLTRKQRDVTSGWVLDQLEHGEEVHLKSFCKFVSDHFKVSICEKTASTYLNEDGFKARVLKKSTSFVPAVGAKKSLHSGWLRVYRISTHQDARGDRKDIPNELDDHLDGLYWDTEKQ